MNDGRSMVDAYSSEINGFSSVFKEKNRNDNGRQMIQIYVG